jgi:hypothetical protein
MFAMIGLLIEREVSFPDSIRLSFRGERRGRPPRHLPNESQVGCHGRTIQRAALGALNLCATVRPEPRP